MAHYSFEDCRREAHKDLGNGADWLRAGDWPSLTPEQDAARREALRLIGEAKAALDRAELQEVIDAKVAGREVVAPEEPEAAPAAAVDLMAALRVSLEQARSARRED